MNVLELHQQLNIPESEYTEILRRLGRKPNLVETYLFSAMWSEHCGYKHSRKYIKTLPGGGAICSGENAGGVIVGDHVITFKVESHNHPSAVEPFQGAATGIGGIIRDVLAMGARPIALLNSLKFGEITNSFSKHIFDGVVKGISAYGNSIGVPTVAGEVSFDKSYTDSPLVNVMAVGLVEKDKIKTSLAKTGNVVIAIGSHTGRDGIHGASFASKELSENSKEDRPSVQIGDPFMKKVLIEATLEILEFDEVVSCQDFGAAGLLSSSSEMAAKGNCGIELYLDQIHLREKDMQPWEIMLSESQERMLFIVTPDGVNKVLNIANKYDVPASVIGKTTESGMYQLFWNGEEIASLPPDLLNDAPCYTLNDADPPYIEEHKNLKLNHTMNIDKAVKLLVADPNFSSKKWVYQQYDHTVGNRTALKPGEAGSAGIWLHEEGGIIGLTIDSNGRQVFLDPYNGTVNTVYEAARNIIAAGMNPLGITNCLNFGNPEKEEVAFQFVKTIEGIKDACNKLNIPVVSGNVSFYNESEVRRVFPTPAIGMVGYADNPDMLISAGFCKDDTLFLIGKDISSNSKIGGSLYQRVLYDFIGGPVDNVDFELETKLYTTITILKEKCLLSGCIDVSEGGLFGALFEGLLHGNTGFNGTLSTGNNIESEIFGEITGRYIISTSKPEQIIMKLNELNVPYRKLGICTGKEIKFNDLCFDLAELKDLYMNSIALEMRS
jgi:phosphoribosylformylglycinamidine synthase